MTIIEFAKMLDVSLNSTQITILNTYVECKEKGQEMLVTMPLGYGRQMLNAIIQRYEGYLQGRADAIEKFAETLKSRLTDAIYSKDVPSMTNLIDDVAEQLKKQTKS